MQLKQFVTPLMLVATFAACTKWVPDTRPIPTEQRKAASTLRLHTADGRIYTVKGAWVRADSVLGWSRGHPVALAAADITKMERQKVDGVKTGVLVGVVAALVAGLIVFQQSDFMVH